MHLITMVHQPHKESIICGLVRLLQMLIFKKGIYTKNTALPSGVLIHKNEHTREGNRGNPPICCFECSGVYLRFLF